MNKNKSNHYEKKNTKDLILFFMSDLNGFSKMGFKEII